MRYLSGNVSCDETNCLSRARDARKSFVRCGVAQAGLVAFLLFQWGLLVVGGRALSFTLDEPSHIAAGYAFLSRGALWMIPQRGHPLLVDAWEALPFYLGHPEVPVETLPGWGTDYTMYAAAFTDEVYSWLPQAEVVSRAPAMLLTILLAAVICRWAGALWGQWGGLAALLLLVFDPTLLAHGRLATNDVGVTALGTLGLYLLWVWSRSPSWFHAFAVGCFWGLALLAKGSGLLWVAFGTLAAMGWMARNVRQRWQVWGQVVCMGLIAVFLLWAGHMFTWGYLQNLPWFPVPAPQYWEGIFYQTAHTDKPITYVLGRWRATGWPGYFPVAFLIKNPAPFLLVSVTGVFNGMRRACRRALYFPVCFGVLYALTAVVIGPNLGYRHFIPVHPTLYLLAAGGILDLWRVRWRLLRWGMVGLGIWYCAGTLRLYPFELAYFNELAGGARSGWRYLEGSNTEWGQGWHALRAFESAQGLIADQVSYTGWEGYTHAAPNDLWGHPLPPMRGSSALFSPALYPAPGDYVLSANSLSGALLADQDNYAWFRYHPPDAVLAESLFYYHVTAAAAPTWLAQCNYPATPLSATAIQEGFGGLSLRAFEFDCRSIWIYPDGGHSRGVYALHAALLLPATLREQLYLQPARPENQFAARHLAASQQSYRQWDSRTWPALALYESPAASPAPPAVATMYAASAASVPATLASTATLTTPLPLKEAFIFRGYGAVHTDSEGISLETWWEISGAPITRPVSIMAHLLTEDGVSLAVADGLGIAPTVLQSGDMIVQHHPFAVAAPQPRLWLRTGVYFLDTLERIPVRGTADAIFVPVID